MLHLKRGAPAAVHELLQLGAAVADERTAVGKQQMVEVELREQPRARLEQALLGGGGIVHERVGHEAERARLAVRSATHHAVGDHERAQRGQVEGRVVGTDRAELTCQQTAGELVADVEARDPLPMGELVQPGAVAVDGTAEPACELAAVTVVVAV